MDRGYDFPGYHLRFVLPLSFRHSTEARRLSFLDDRLWMRVPDGGLHDDGCLSLVPLVWVRRNVDYLLQSSTH